ncbi:hypothetical protein K1T71_003957 [Dendrolimus kikuchii]|uniref:Uncharacterized protein n=1 Tax=Dendrolimus kikuchii TaxID=765133 RepID=A0ACC1DAD5_9NEOP|nr:hypothetical protein K1T71_003957 [Dendrolimus kikuchii]
MSPVKLYKHLLRECEKLPPDASKFYKFSVKQSFKQHKFEPDPDRVKQIISKSIEDAKWIVNKYSQK